MTMLPYFEAYGTILAYLHRGGVYALSFSQSSLGVSAFGLGMLDVFTFG